MSESQYSWRAAAVVGSLLLLGLAGWPILPDYYEPEVRSYLPSLLCIPASVGFGIACFRSPAHGDRLFGWVGCLLGGGLLVAFACRALYYLGVLPPLV